MCRLQPVALFEDDVEADADHGHQEDCEGVARCSLEFGHGFEVHAVDGADEGRGEEDGGP